MAFGFDVQLLHFVIQQMCSCGAAPLGVAVTRNQVIWSPVPTGAVTLERFLSASETVFLIWQNSGVGVRLS